MEGVLLVVFGLVFLVPAVALVRLAWRSGEECPEAEPDISDEERAWMRYWSQSNKWEAS